MKRQATRVTFVLSGILIRYADYRKRLEVEASTIESGIDGLVARCPALREILFTEQGELRRMHRLFLNGEAIEWEDKRRRLAPDDTVELVTAVAGG